MIVAEHLGLSWSINGDPFGHGIDALAGLAVRDNPKRAHLVVSKVLAKHVPVLPSTAFAAAAQVASLVQLPGAAVVGFCETATGLGHAVAAQLEAPYVHTTRRTDVRGFAFEEAHSHAVAHRLEAVGSLQGDGPLVLVDDELTTGATALNTLAVLPPRERVVIASLLDLRTEEARRDFAGRAEQLNVDVRVVALVDGTLHLPSDVLTRAQELQSRLRALDDVARAPVGLVKVHDVPWPQGLPRSGRHGLLPAAEVALADAVSAVAARLEPHVSGRVLVVGNEELMHVPNLLALALEHAGHDVLVQSTTRSPVLPWDVDGYAVRHRLSFPSAEDPSRTAYLYNVNQPYDHVVVVTEDPAASAGPLAASLQPYALKAVHVVAL